MTAKNLYPFLVVTVLVVAAGALTGAFQGPAPPSPAENSSDVAPAPQKTPKPDLSTMVRPGMSFDGHVDLTELIQRTRPIVKAHLEGQSDFESVTFWVAPSVLRPSKDGVKLNYDKDGKAFVVVSILSNYPNFEAINDELKPLGANRFLFRTEPWNVVRDSSSLKQHYTKTTQVLTRPTLAATLAYVGVGAATIAPGSDTIWRFRFDFPDQAAAEEFVSAVDSGAIVGEVTMEYQAVVSYIDGFCSTLIEQKAIIDALAHVDGKRLTTIQKNALMAEMILVAKRISDGYVGNRMDIDWGAVLGEFFVRQVRMNTSDTKLNEILYLNLLPAIVEEISSDTMLREHLDQTQVSETTASAKGVSAGLSATVPMEFIMLGGNVAGTNRNEAIKQIIDIAANKYGVALKYENQTNRLVPTTFDLYQVHDNRDAMKTEFRDIIRRTEKKIASETVLYDASLHSMAAFDKHWAEKHVKPAREKAERDREKAVEAAKIRDDQAKRDKRNLATFDNEVRAFFPREFSGDLGFDAANKRFWLPESIAQISKISVSGSGKSFSMTIELGYQSKLKVRYYTRVLWSSKRVCLEADEHFPWASSAKIALKYENGVVSVTENVFLCENCRYHYASDKLQEQFNQLIVNALVKKLSALKIE